MPCARQYYLSQNDVNKVEVNPAHRIYKPSHAVCINNLYCTVFYLFIYIPSIHTGLDNHKDMELVICLMLS